MDNYGLNKEDGRTTRAMEVNYTQSTSIVYFIGRDIVRAMICKVQCRTFFVFYSRDGRQIDRQTSVQQKQRDANYGLMPRKIN